jgi:hypothetical protein
MTGINKSEAVAMAFSAISIGVAASDLQASNLSYPVVSILCGLFVAFKFIAGAIASLVLVWAAIKYIGSVDDPGARKYTKDVLRYVIIGLMLIVLSEVFVLYVARGRDIRACSAWCAILPC